MIGSQVLSPSAVWAKTSDFMRLPEVEIFDEPIGVEDAWKRFAVRAGSRLVSFDIGRPAQAGHYVHVRLKPDTTCTRS